LGHLYDKKSNLILIGELLYNYNIHFFISAALVSTVSMIGSIVLVTDYSNNGMDKRMDLSNGRLYANNVNNVYFWNNRFY